ncbi:MAG: CHAP domain-containing protein [Desulfobacteraceae bacterium]|nr:CHAP domain-containing protein [Desulfobacteraceae bacterium]
MKRALRKHFVKTMVFFLCIMIVMPSVISAQVSSNIVHNIECAKNLYLLNLNAYKDRHGEIEITNLEPNNAKIKLETYDKEGNLLETETSVIKIGADETRIFDIKALPSNAVSLKMKSDNIITSSIIFKTADGYEPDEITAVKESSRQLDFQFDENVIHKNVSIMNPNDINADINVIIFDEEGNEIKSGFFQTLFPMESMTLSLTDVFDDKIHSLATIRLQSDTGITGIQFVNSLISDFKTGRVNGGFPSTVITSKYSRSSYARYENAFYVSNSSLAGQCTWYAYGRVTELVDSGYLDRSVGDHFYSAFWGKSNRHAKNWPWPSFLGGTWISTTVDELPMNKRRKGLIAVWQFGDYGHVGFVEEVSADKLKYRLSDFNRAGGEKYRSAWYNFKGTSDKLGGVYPSFYELELN